MSDVDAMKHMAWSVASTGALMWAGHASSCFVSPAPIAAIQWTSLVVLLSTLYYLFYHLWVYCVRRRRAHQRRMSTPMRNPHESAYTDLPQMPPPDCDPDEEALSSSESGQDRQARPHLTASSVYVYVYGWGFLLFVCLYCASGLYEASSCWWAMGMMTLCLDELIMRGVGRGWVATIGFLLILSISSVWWNASGSRALEMNLGQIMTEVVFPVLAPVIFFSLKSSVRVVARDVYALCEVALPFMVIIAISVMVGSIDSWSVSSGQPEIASVNSQVNQQGTRRADLELYSPKNATTPQETHASFLSIDTTRNFTLASKNDSNHKTFNLNANNPNHPITTPTSAESVAAEWERTRCALVLLLAPLISASTLLNITSCVVNGFVAEFLSSFMLVLSTKFAASHPDPQWAVVGVCYAGVCFVLLVLRRKSL